MDLIFNVILVIVVIVLGLRLLNYILNPSPQDTSVKDFDKFAKSIDTSSFSDNQKKSTEKFLSDISKELKNDPVESKESKDYQTDNEGILNIIRDSEKDKQSNNEERLEITINDVKYQVSDSETIGKIKELNDPNKNNISSLFDLKEYYKNGNIKKETNKYLDNNVYFELFYDESGNKTKENCYLIQENRLRNEIIYEDKDNYKYIEYYEGGETRQSFFVDGIQEGIENVFDKNGNLVEEHTFKNGKNTYYKRFIDGKVSEESVKEDEPTEEEVEIMRLAKSIETSSSFVSLVELLPTNLSDYEGETFYDVTEEFRILLKNGSEVASGFVCISHNANYWDDDDESHDDIQSHNEVMIVNGKQFTDYDDEKWGEQEVKGRELESLESKRIATFWDDGEAEEFFNSYIDKKCNKFK